MRVRGPVGGPRRDFYTSMLAMHAGGPWEKAPKFRDFAMPWARPDPVDDDDEDDRGFRRDRG